MDLQLLTAREFQALTTTISITVWTVVLSILLGSVIGIFLSQQSTIKQRVYQFILLLVVLISPFFHALVWQNSVLILVQNGYLNFNALIALRSVSGVICILTISYTPLVALMIQNAIASIPKHVIDAGRLYANRARVFTRIVLPYLIPTVLSAGVLVGVFVFNTFDVPAFFETNVYITEIFSMFSSRFDTQRAFLLSILPVVVTILGTWVLFSRMYKNKPLLSAKTTQNVGISVPQNVIWVGRLVFGLLILIGFILPLLSIMTQSALFSSTTVLELADSIPVIWNSISTAFIASFGIVVIGFIGLLYKNHTYIRILGFSLLAVPAVTFGIGAVTLFNQPFLNTLYATPLLLILIYILRFSPLLAELMYARSLQISPNELASAKIYSGSWVKRLREIVLPYYKETRTIGFVIALWLVVTELPITLLLQPPGFQTITSRLFILLHYGSETLMNSLLLVLLVIVLLPVILIRSFIKTRP